MALAAKRWSDDRSAKEKCQKPKRAYTSSGTHLPRMCHVVASSDSISNALSKCAFTSYDFVICAFVPSSSDTPDRMIAYLKDI